MYFFFLIYCFSFPLSPADDDSLGSFTMRSRAQQERFQLHFLLDSQSSSHKFLCKHDTSGLCSMKCRIDDGIVNVVQSTCVRVFGQTRCRGDNRPPSTSADLLGLNLDWVDFLLGLDFIAARCRLMSAHENLLDSRPTSALTLPRQQS
jgi:hypothetical protein